jgi:hypothetical protein
LKLAVFVVAGQRKQSRPARGALIETWCRF